MNQRQHYKIGIVCALCTMMCALCTMMACSSSDTTQDDGFGKTQDSVPIAGEHLLGFTARLANESSAQAAPASRVTRAVGSGELTTELLRNVGFGVYCWYTGAAPFGTITPAEASFMLMRNQRVVWDAALSHPSWTYSPSKYWPLEENHLLTFRAYAPYVSYNLVEAVVTNPGTYTSGMPLLPVVVGAEDYKNGTQHDPLWGTGKLVNSATGEYYPENPAPPEEPLYPDNKRYGTLYDDITFKESGDWRLTADTRDGFIDWYFHHGMAKLVFNCYITPEPGCSKVVIHEIKVSPLYKQGLLDISSPTEKTTDKPYWYDRDGNMTVDLDATCLAANPNPMEISIDDQTATTGPVSLLSSGLLIIPRDYTSGTPMTIKITYSIDSETDKLEATATLNDQIFYGNTVYTLGLSLTPETKGLKIDIVQAAFNAWEEGGFGSHTVYNW